MFFWIEQHYLFIIVETLAEFSQSRIQFSALAEVCEDSKREVQAYSQLAADYLVVLLLDLEGQTELEQQTVMGE